ncbi:MAG: rRNA adenine N-6-methyltransferase family protein [Candidatus Sulfotelmatobacter sp.]|jgi:phospholipid N-methyltransferase
MPSQAAKKSAARSLSPALSSLALFARNFLKSPAMLGSVIPSSSFLVNDMMRQVDWERARVVVEYGPGVGTFTREILKRMRPDAILVAIELNTDFVEYLSDHVRDSRFRVVHGSAARVRGVLAEQNLAPADYIISGLPYLNMPDSLRREILEESRLALRAEGSMLLFQYTRTLQPYLESSFSSVKLNFQLFNILPALIFHCTR